MESHHIFGYTVTGIADTSFANSHPGVTGIPHKLFDSIKVEFGNSPNSPFSSQFDSESFSSATDCKEQHSSNETPSRLSPHSSNSSLETSNYNHRLSPAVDACGGRQLPYLAGRYSAVPDAYGSQNVTYTLQELESALMAPDGDEEETKTPNPSFGGNSQPRTPAMGPRAWSQEVQQTSQVARPQYALPSRFRMSNPDIRFEMHHKAMEEATFQGFPPGNLKQLLIACAKAMSDNNMADFDRLIERARSAVDISGEPIQRLGTYMVEGLTARKEASGNKIYHTLKCREPESEELLTYMHILYDVCPYLKFGYMAANGAIAEACRNEDRIHIVDFQIAQGTQWITLLQALAARPGGPPHVRITGIDDPVSQHARGACLNAVGRRLAVISQKFNIPLEFHPVPVFAPDITMEMLDVRSGEALAVNFPLQLHHTPDESVDVNNPRDGLLRMIKSLNPRVVTLIEQESNTNTTPFFNRFLETLDYYSAMFESIDVTMARDSKDRINVEMHCLARDMVNIIACEGKERVERHELLGKWKSRFTMAGFRQFPLSTYVNSVIGSLLKCYSEHYTLEEREGAMLLGWKKRNLVSASAWH
ncbi:unnamed protein product [Rhodiola kirilowii]